MAKIVQSKKLDTIIEKHGNPIVIVKHFSDQIKNRISDISIPVPQDVSEDLVQELEKYIGPYNIKHVDHACSDHFLERSITMYMYQKHIQSKYKNKKDLKILTISAKYQKEIKSILKLSQSCQIDNLVVKGDEERTQDLIDENIDLNVRYLSYEQLSEKEDNYYDLVISIHSIYDITHDQVKIILDKSKYKRMETISFLTPRAYQGAPETYDFGTSFKYIFDGGKHKLYMYRQGNSSTYINYSYVHKEISLHGGYFYLGKFFKLNINSTICGQHYYQLNMQNVFTPFIHNIEYKHHLTMFKINDEVLQEDTKLLNELVDYCFKNNEAKSFIQSAAAYYSNKVRMQNKVHNEGYEKVLLFAMLKGTAQRKNVGELYHEYVNQKAVEKTSWFAQIKEQFKNAFKYEKEYDLTEMQKILNTEIRMKSHAYEFEETTYTKIMNMANADPMYQYLINGDMNTDKNKVGKFWQLINLSGDALIRKAKSMGVKLSDAVKRYVIADPNMPYNEIAFSLANEVVHEKGIDNYRVIIKKSQIKVINGVPVLEDKNEIAEYYMPEQHNILHQRETSEKRVEIVKPWVYNLMKERDEIKRKIIYRNRKNRKSRAAKKKNKVRVNNELKAEQQKREKELDDMYERCNFDKETSQSILPEIEFTEEEVKQEMYDRSELIKSNLHDFNEKINTLIKQQNWEKVESKRNNYSKNGLSIIAYNTVQSQLQFSNTYSSLMTESLQDEFENHFDNIDNTMRYQIENDDEIEEKRYTDKRSSESAEQYFNRIIKDYEEIVTKEKEIINDQKADQITKEYIIHKEAEIDDLKEERVEYSFDENRYQGVKTQMKDQILLDKPVSIFDITFDKKNPDKELVKPFLLLPPEGQSRNKVIKAAIMEYLKELIFVHSEDETRYPQRIKDIIASAKYLYANPESLYKKRFIEIDAPAGAGKTVYMGAKYNPLNDIITCPFKAVLGKTKSEIREIYGEDKVLSIETAEKIFTELPVYNGALWIDEFRNLLLGQLLVIAGTFGGDTIYLLAGSEQGERKIIGENGFKQKYYHQHFPLPKDLYKVNTTLRLKGPAFEFFNKINGDRFYTLSVNECKIHIVLPMFHEFLPEVDLSITQRRMNVRKFEDFEVTNTFKNATGLSEGIVALSFDDFCDNTFQRYKDATSVAFTRAKNDIYIMIDKNLDFNVSKIKAFMDCNKIEYDYLCQSGEFRKPSSTKDF